MTASGRPNTCKSRGIDGFTRLETGARVRNTYATYPLLGHSSEKSELIPHNDIEPHGLISKVPAVKDRHAVY